jgi:PAS domain S-box-containing protein
MQQDLNDALKGIAQGATPKLSADAMEMLAEYAGIGFFNVHIPTGAIYLNRVIAQLTGYEPGDIPHTADTKFMLTFEEDRPRVFAAMDALDRGEKDAYAIEYRMRRVDGSVVSIAEHAIVLERDKEGHVVRLAGLGQDLSELKWAEERARSIEKEARHLLKDVPDEILAKQNRLLRAANAAAAMIIGGIHHDYEVVLRQAMSILAESVLADRVIIFRNREVDGKLQFFNRFVWSPDISSYDYGDSLYDMEKFLPNWETFAYEGTPVVLLYRDMPQSFKDFEGMSDVKAGMLLPLNLHGEFWGSVAFLNCTEEKLYTEDEAEIMGAGMLVIASSVSRNETFMKLNESRATAMAGTKAKGEFLSRVSHEIRTPMNAIIGMTQIADKTDDVDKIKACLAKIETSSEQLLDIINDVLDMSKIEAGKMEIEHAPFDFADLLRHVSSVNSVRLDQKKQKLVIDIGEPFAHYVIGDRLRLSQVLINLIGNASKFSPEGGEITIRTEKPRELDEGYLLAISVIDNGIGISADKIGQLFDSFEQADGSISRRFGGTGLGLAITKNLVELMGGSIAVESTVGKGSSFRFVVNIGQGELLPTRDDGDGKNSNSAPVPDLSDKRILVAEDIEINREIVAGVLEDTHAELIFAENGQLAVELFKADPTSFDLIFMDIQMPEMDGLTATETIRHSSAENARTIPIIAMTANAFKEDAESCIDAGMNEHVSKPIDVPELYGVLRRYLQAK